MQFTFRETPAGQPKALRTMYWPGDAYGQSFMYKRTRATEIAQVQTTKEEVPAEEAAAPVPAPVPAPAPAVVAEYTTPAALPQTASNMPQHHGDDGNSSAHLPGGLEEVVNPTDDGVLAPTVKPTLTLITCFPFYYVGHAPKRFIVRAEETRESPVEAASGESPLRASR